MISTAITKFTCKFSADTFPIDYLFHPQPNFCYLRCNVFPFTAPMLSFISAALNRLHSTSVFLYVLGLTRCTRQSNGPYWLPISQPSCPGLWRWRKAVVGSQCSVFSFGETPLLFFSHYPWVPCLCKPPSQQHASASVRGQILLRLFLFISPPHSCVTVTVTEDNVWACYDKSFSVYVTSYISDLLAHLIRNLSLFSCPMTPWKETIICSESKNLCRRRDLYQQPHSGNE